MKMFVMDQWGYEVRVVRESLAIKLNPKTNMYDLVADGKHTMGEYGHMAEAKEALSDFYDEVCDFAGDDDEVVICWEVPADNHVVTEEEAANYDNPIPGE